MNIIIFSGHCWSEKRRAGFHHFTKALLDQGHKVLFYTAPVSALFHLNRLKKSKHDHRLATLKTYPANQLHQLSSQLSILTHYTHLHPFKSIKPVEAFLDWHYRKQMLNPSTLTFIKSADIAIFESCYALHFYQQVQELNPTIKFVYRVSDDLQTLPASQRLIDLEQAFIKQAHLISSPSSYLAQKFPLPSTQLCLHGINKTLFQIPYPNPYQHALNIVFVGVSHIDLTFIELTHHAFPNVQFHLIGPIKPTIQAHNVTFYGELPFEQTIPYIIHANVGLQMIKYCTGAESFTDSLKILQYTYCGLAIVAPDFLKTSRINTFYYQPNQSQSMIEALQAALEFDQKKHHAELQASIHDWDTVARSLLQTT